MKKQIFNPFLPSYEYIPDGEPHVFNNRLYLYGSHDRFNGKVFCENDYVCWSASIDDLSDWQFNGYIYHLKQDKHRYLSPINKMYAPDVAKGKDGKYYLYYFVGYTSRIGVAVSNKPEGPFEFLDYVKYQDGTLLGKKKEPLQFDPAIFIDDDGRVYLYTGFAPDKANIFMIGKKPTKHGPMCFELEDDMTTIKERFTYIGIPSNITSKDTDYKDGHAFFEASSIRKFKGKYYFIYSSYLGHELCYAMSDSPKGPFEYKGTLISLGDIGIDGYTSNKNSCDFTGNTHGSIVEVNNRYYVFYHRQTNMHQFSRQACAEEIFMDDNGEFKQVNRTSSGINQKPLIGLGTYEARIACNLISSKGNYFYGVIKPLIKRKPYFTQSGKDREDNPEQYIANIRNGDIVGYKYFDFKNITKIKVLIKGTCVGKLVVKIKKDGSEVGHIEVKPTKEYRLYEGDVELNGIQSLYFEYIGKGHLDFKEFTFE